MTPYFLFIWLQLLRRVKCVAFKDEVSKKLWLEFDTILITAIFEFDMVLITTIVVSCGQFKTLNPIWRQIYVKIKILKNTRTIQFLKIANIFEEMFHLLSKWLIAFFLKNEKCIKDCNQGWRSINNSNYTTKVDRILEHFNLWVSYFSRQKIKT